MASMRRLMLTVLVVAAVLVPLLPRSALACSAGPDYNPVAESEVIVVGRLLGWSEGDVASPPPPDGSLLVPIRVTMVVERVLTGRAPASITIVDRASLHRIPAMAGRAEQTTWVGAAGACGSFDEDPTAKYAVMGLWRNPDGTYRPNRIHTFYLGEQPPAAVWDAVVARLTHWGPVAFPLTGAAARARYDDETPTGFLTALAAGVLLIVGAVPVCARLTRERST
jgi:hypothetical protein